MRDSSNELHTLSDAYEHTVVVLIDLLTNPKASHILNLTIISIDKQAIFRTSQIRTRATVLFQLIN